MQVFNVLALGGKQRNFKNFTICSIFLVVDPPFTVREIACSQSPSLRVHHLVHLWPLYGILYNHRLAAPVLVFLSSGFFHFSQASRGRECILLDE